jgi:TPR repeat protein
MVFPEASPSADSMKVPLLLGCWRLSASALLLTLSACVSDSASPALVVGSDTPSSSADRLKALNSATKDALAKRDYKRAQELATTGRVWVMAGTPSQRPVADASAMPGQLGITIRHIIEARQANARSDFASAMQNYKEIDADEAAIRAEVQGTYRTALPTDFNSRRRVNAIRNQFDDLAFARTQVGTYYEKGQGTPQDYASARSWYIKAVSTRNENGEFAFGGAAPLRLGFLFANGLGGPKDTALAKELFQVMGGAMGARGADYALLLDHGMLPRTLDDATGSYVQTAKAKIAEADQARAAAEQAQRERAQSDYDKTHPQEVAARKRREQQQADDANRQRDTPKSGGLSWIECKVFFTSKDSLRGLFGCW